MPAPGENVLLGSKEVAWLKRDALLFAVSIGAGTDELNFVFVSEHPHTYQGNARPADHDLGAK